MIGSRKTIWRLAVALLVTTMVGRAVGAVGPTAYSWRGDGQGVFPAKGLVTTFKGGPDGKGTNIVWRSALPNWGGNAPIVVKDRVFVMCQEGVDIECPQLLCLDVNTGNILWRKPVDHLDAWPVEKATEAKAMRRQEHVRWAKYMRWWNKIYWDNQANKWIANRAGSARDKPQQVPAEMIPLLKEAEADGLKFPEYWGTGISLDALIRGRFGLGEVMDKRDVDNFNRCVKERIYWYPGWTSEGPFYGSVMGSVVSDGQYVYAVTALDTAVCYDLDGNCRWAADMAPTFIHTGKNPAPGDRWNTNISSPVLADGKLIYYHRDGWMMYAYDTGTGKLAWKAPAPMESKVRPRGSQAAPNYALPQAYEGHMAPGGTPVVMELGKTRVVVSGHGMVVRVADGKLLGMVSVPNTNETESAANEAPPSLDGADRAPATNSNAEAEVFGSTYSSWVADKDVIYATSEKRGMGAVRLRLDGDKLVSEPIWLDKGFNNMEGPNLAVFAGALYGVVAKKRGFAEMNPATGGVVATTTAPAGWCTGWVISRDGVAVYKGGKSGFLVCQLPGMKPLGEGSLDDTPTSEQRERNIAQLGFPVVNSGPAGITAFGNRIFYRTNHYLWCIGDPTQAWIPPETIAEQGKGK
jgi:outer membrane protein assembly factor BamB